MTQSVTRTETAHYEIQNRAWHQHVSSSRTATAGLVRVHDVDARYDARRVLLAPPDPWSERPRLEDPDPSTVQWTDVRSGRPA